jgi:Na+-translocating ferredoxin:NAD+ oxidoreductase RnfC subunit
MHRSRSHVAEELSACIHCNECIVACPALHAPISIETLNQETLAGPISREVARFAQSCYQCGACVPVCPAGLHRDAMMLWIKMRLLRGDAGRAGASGEFPVAPRVARSAWVGSAWSGGEERRTGSWR